MSSLIAIAVTAFHFIVLFHALCCGRGPWWSRSNRINKITTLFLDELALFTSFRFYRVVSP
jgi:hypothetical protein